MKCADLHTHSYYSDGELSPKQVVRLAKKRKIKHLALTDHNSVKGIEEAVKEGKKQGVNIIPAVELRTNKGEILAYFIDYKDKELIKKIKKENKKLQKELKDKIKALKKSGYSIKYNELEKTFPKAKGNYNLFHVLQILQNKKYGKIKFLRKKASKKKISKAKTMTVIQCIHLVKKAGGVPVMAHPWLEDKSSFKNMSKYVKAGLAGLEISNGDSLAFMREKSGRKNIVQFLKRIAKQHKLILTRGTDFHGDKTAKIMPGCHVLGKNNCEESVVKKLKSLSKN